MSALRWFVLVVAVLSTLACSEDKATGSIPPQTWNNIVVRVETRPDPPQPGMNEIWVIMNETGGRPVTDYIVSLGTTATDNKVQAIQDGWTGVYRRAIRVRDPAADKLVVALEKGGQVHALAFPFRPAVKNGAADSPAPK